MSRHALLFLLLAASACSADAETYLVLPDGSGAYPTIQAAINSASDGDIILLADGVFLGAGNRDIDFSGEAISVQSQSDSPLDCVIDCQGSTSAHHRGFIFSSCETGSSVLRGVTVTNAYVAGSFPAGDGGGVYCEDSSPEIVNCVFSDNVAVGGAGAFCYHGSDPSFTDCTFTGNRELGGTGGAMYCYFVCAPTLLRCDFVGNVPSGLHFQLGSQPDIRDCTFQDHESYGISLSSSDATIVSSSFFGNAGLAIRIAESTVDMSNCALWSNRAEEGGALYFNWGSSGVISDCLFHHNASDGSGGVAWCDDASVTFVSCTMAYNEAGSGAGGIDCGSATVTLENTIIAFSTGGQAIAGNADLSCCDLYGNAGGDWIGGIAGQYGIDGNISEDPIFCGPWSDDFTLQSDSPCAPFSPPNPECDLIGAEPIGCEPPTAVFPPGDMTSWGGVKALFREGTD